LLPQGAAPVERVVHICCGDPDKLDAVDYPKALLAGADCGLGLLGRALAAAAHSL
jgi:hypothetical protein